MLKNKTIFQVTILALFLIVAAGCHPRHACGADKPFRVLAATFPVHLFALNIMAGAENVELSLLIPASAGCPHDFALRPADMRKIETADALIINGAGLEEFLDKALASVTSAPPIIDASKDIPLLPDPGHGTNPHTFAAPRQARLMAQNIAAGLSALNAANSAVYSGNIENYADKLAVLSARFESLGHNAANRGIALEHDGLAYLAANADLEVVAILQGGDSAARLAAMRKTLESSRPALLAGDSQFPDRLIRILANETMIPWARLDTCASGPANAEPAYYENVMEENLKILERYFE